MNEQQTQTRIEVAIAVLQTNYEHIDKRLADQSVKMDVLNTKFDALINRMTEEDTRSKIRQRVFTALSHVTTGGVTLLIAKILHVPLTLG